jgi:hypothetical protein
VLSLLGLKQDYSFAEIGLSFFGNLKLFDYIKGVGPMGLFSLFCSFFIPLSLFLFFSIGYREKSKLLIESRNKSKILEGEFTNSLFQLGNRMGDGTPAEIAFGKVSESSKGMATEEFFRITNNNMRSLGFSLEKALFDKRRGAIIYFPSNLISTSMHILIKSVKKGLKVAAESLMSIAEYIKNVNKINERLRDLLAEIISDMKSNMTFLAPLLSGIVVGLAAMITLILSKLAEIINVASLSGGEELAGIGGIADLLKNFNVESLMPPYYLQIIVGVYILEIIFILSRTLVNIDAGKDNLKEVYEISNNLRSAGLLYIIVALISVLALSALAGVALSNISL